MIVNPQSAFRACSVDSALKVALTAKPVETIVLDDFNDRLKPFSGESRNKLIKQTTDHIQKQIDAQLKDRADKQAKSVAFNSALAWLDDIIARGPILEANQATRLHKLFAAGITENLQAPESPTNSPGDMLTDFNHAFVVKHDWAAAFANAEGMEGELKLPYELCAFEFRINGRSVTALAWDTEASIPTTGARLGFTLTVECEGIWFDYGGSRTNPDDLLIPFVWKQLQAICVALDADVAVHEVVRAPVALNAKRERTGKPPIRDHYVIDLARRHRISNPTSGTSEPGKVRLHFRRGHWRHYTEHKTWIKWMLVGNPALGFIQQRYSL